MILTKINEKVPRLTILFDWFIIYSFLGWMYETIYCSIDQGKYCERGFLYGPICPIYGVCTVLAILLLDRVKNNIVLFFSCAFLASSVEYIVSFCMEGIFGRRWWDYSDQLLNLNGRICLGAAIVFGLIGIVVIRYLHPMLERYLHISLNAEVIKIISKIYLAIFLFDLFVTIKMNL